MSDFVGEIFVEKLLSEVVHYKLVRDKTGKLDNQSSVGVWLGSKVFGLRRAFLGHDPRDPPMQEHLEAT